MVRTTDLPHQSETPFLKRLCVLSYGLAAYLLFILSVIYYVGFLANTGVPNGIDAGPARPSVVSVAINVGLVAVFGIQHSGMARPWFKDWWTRVLPEPIERSTYVVTSAIVLLVIAWLWRPLPTVLWEINGLAAWVFWGVYGLGVVIVMLASFQISHTRLFGLQQTWSYFADRESPAVSFQTPGFYRYVRHPLMTGMLLWFWATPHMTLGHFIFAGGFSIYIVVGTRLEERMLIDTLGDEYRQYRQTVPMFLPRFGTSIDSVSDETSSQR